MQAGKAPARRTRGSYRQFMVLVATTAALAAAATTRAEAGAFALREQSAAGQGASFAGVAAGGALSSMFWNPAIITQFSGKTLEADGAYVMPHASHSYTAATLAVLPAFANAPGNSGKNAFVPSGYAAWQLNERFWLGLSLNAPFGLSVGFPQAWAGAAYGQDSKVTSYNFAPTVAYKINDMVSVAVGLQAQYMKVSYDAFLNAAPLIMGNVTGSGWSFGWTAGVTITPLPRTQIGIGYRSGIDQKINGVLTAPVPGSTPGSVNLSLSLPDTLTVGLRQGITDKFTLLAGVEWAHWNRIGTANLLQPSGAPATIGGAAVRFPFQYSDGWFYSLGGEYAFDPALTLRAGIGFEKSPITDQVRTPRLPDADRIWYSAGFSYKPAQIRGVTIDFGYSFIDVKNASVSLGPGTGNPWSGATVYTGSVSSNINIVSIGLRYQWDAESPRATMLPTK